MNSKFTKEAYLWKYNFQIINGEKLNLENFSNAN